jgi:hypothetical protein
VACGDQTLAVDCSAAAAANMKEEMITLVLVRMQRDKQLINLARKSSEIFDLSKARSNAASACPQCDPSLSNFFTAIFSRISHHFIW